CLQYKSYAFSF
nr:immunoglobulin light chain junction region [Macaca mulatta]MOV79856.1 immunoglobulin light chain junction region [Macaca mulatta]MOV79946.1 immunoglobulin light chain junction region [Macaca mulatta]MOV84146.1 immunoglobulin light chain junction region [Macaca mulatta]MOV86204.1 immunoglobulin light chain junction region [Macaca mulatta]